MFNLIATNHSFSSILESGSKKRLEKVPFFQNERARMRVIQIAGLAAFPKKRGKASPSALL